MYSQYGREGGRAVEARGDEGLRGQRVRRRRRGGVGGVALREAGRERSPAREFLDGAV